MTTHLFGGRFQGRRVLLTGHTGFKGSWLATWFVRLGAEVHGLALDPQPHETLYGLLGLADQVASDNRFDVRDAERVRKLVDKVGPQVVLHLAAQPLVRLSFDEPASTFSTNVMGTVNVLDAIRVTKTPCSTVIVTTDKCYENREWLHSYREVDAMGGYDPYSASKGCAELVVSSYRRSFFHDNDAQRVGSARAGNVIGGGDWAEDRIVPDVFRAIQSFESVPVRNRHATRPWQHVLEPLSGYLALASALLSNAGEDAETNVPISEFCSAFNFGPNLTSNRTVADVVAAILKHTGGEWTDRSDPNGPHEASKLNLAIDRAYHLLGWQPVWDFDETIKATTDWYTGHAAGQDAREITLRQIQQYEANATDASLPWATEKRR